MQPLNTTIGITLACLSIASGCGGEETATNPVVTNPVVTNPVVTNPVVTNPVTETEETPKELPPSPMSDASPALEVVAKTPTAAAKGLVTVNRFEISRSKKRYGDMVSVKAVATMQGEIGSLRSLATKMSCKQGKFVIADSGWLKNKGSSFLPQSGSVAVEGAFFSSHSLTDLPSPCELEFYLWPRYENAGPLGWACYDGTQIEQGRCTPSFPLSPLASGPLLDAVDVQLEVLPASSKVRLRATIRHNQVILGNANILSKLSCSFGDKHVADVHKHRLGQGLALIAGESSQLGDVLFAKYWLGFEHPPSTCSLEISLVTKSRGEDEKTNPIYQGCYRDSVLKKGTCQGFGTKNTQSVLPTKKNLTVDRVQTKLRMAKDKVNIEYVADLNVMDKLKPEWSVVAETTCRSGAGKIQSITKVEDVPLGQLSQGDTSRARAYDYVKAPANFVDEFKSCDIQFLASPAPARGQDFISRKQQWVLLTKYCYQDGATKLGACAKGKAKRK